MKCASSGCGVEFGIFNWKYRCGRCVQMFCNAHIVKDISYFESVPQFNKDSNGEGLCPRCLRIWEDVWASSEAIRPFSASFRGKVPLDSTKPQERISTDWRRDKADSDRELRLLAAASGFDLIFEMDFDKSTGEEPGSGKGTHYYTIWRAHGVAGHRRSR
jgi:hypothetical protein